MRLIVFIVAILVGGGPAVAQSWREYSYPDLFFAVAFPSDPQMETTTYQAEADGSVEAHVDSVHQAGWRLCLSPCRHSSGAILRYHPQGRGSLLG
jgi:hypothetical protein